MPIIRVHHQPNKCKLHIMDVWSAAMKTSTVKSLYISKIICAHWKQFVSELWHAGLISKPPKRDPEYCHCLTNFQTSIHLSHDLRSDSNICDWYIIQKLNARRATRKSEPHPNDDCIITGRQKPAQLVQSGFIGIRQRQPCLHQCNLQNHLHCCTKQKLQTISPLL